MAIWRWHCKHGETMKSELESTKCLREEAREGKKPADGEQAVPENTINRLDSDLDEVSRQLVSAQPVEPLVAAQEDCRLL
jgi:hypothetical protein